MDTIQLVKMPREWVDYIVRFIKAKRESPELKERYINQLLREDILALLDRYCTVVYYPIDDKKNNGFHVSYPDGEQSIDIVYINTNQTKEKQIFTAAHELGHIWKLDRHIQEALGIQLSYDQQEQVMNRFAAELLMPSGPCAAFVSRRNREFLLENGTMKAVDLLRTIVAVMNEYFVPYKAVVLRLFELNILPDESAKILLEGNDDLPFDAVQQFVENTAKEEGYSRLFQVDKRKWIEGLKELLDEADQGGGIAEYRIECIRKRFGLDLPDSGAALQNLVPIEKEEEADRRAKASRH